MKIFFWTMNELRLYSAGGSSNHYSIARCQYPLPASALLVKDENNRGARRHAAAMAVRIRIQEEEIEY